MSKNGHYPASLTIDYPNRSLNRMSTLFRIFIVLPILFILVLFMNESTLFGLVILPTIFMLLFRAKYPKWWFDWNHNMINFCFRITSFICLMDDKYPSTDDQQNIHIELPYPDASKDLNRWLPLIKWLLALPHYIVLACFGVAAVVGVIIAWFAILFTEKYPKSIFEFVTSVMRYELRVLAYAFILTTDEYPPFSLD